MAARKRRSEHRACCDQREQTPSGVREAQREGEPRARGAALRLSLGAIRRVVNLFFSSLLVPPCRPQAMSKRVSARRMAAQAEIVPSPAQRATSATRIRNLQACVLAFASASANSPDTRLRTQILPKRSASRHFQFRPAALSNPEAPSLSRGRSASNGLADLREIIAAWLALSERSGRRAEPIARSALGVPGGDTERRCKSQIKVIRTSTLGERVWLG